MAYEMVEVILQYNITFESKPQVKDRVDSKIKSFNLDKKE